MTVTDVHIERHRDFDRVLFTLAGDGSVFWQVKPVAQAVPHGGGAPVNVGGEGLLQVDIMGTSPSTNSGARQYAEPGDLTTPDAQPIVAVHFTGSVDQITQAFVGTAATRPDFSARTFSSPARLALDIYR